MYTLDISTVCTLDIKGDLLMLTKKGIRENPKVQECFFEMFLNTFSINEACY